jgi:hypothetical protein
MERFAIAPWATSVKLVSAVATVVLLGVALVPVRIVSFGARVLFGKDADTALAALPLCILAFGVLSGVRGYRFDGSTLVVERLLWESRVELAGLDRAWHDPAAMRRSVRLVGNGGLFSVTGIYRSGALGRYRAFVTDPARSVVLRCPARTVVVSPAEPDAMLAGVGRAFPGADVRSPSPARGR